MNEMLSSIPQPKKNTKRTIAILITIMSIVLASFSTIVYWSSNNALRTTPQPRWPLINIDKVDWDNNTGQITAYLENFGQPTSVTDIYGNGTLDSQASVVPREIATNETAKITLSKTYPIMPKSITIEVHTTNSTLGHDVTFIGFQMLRLYWNETTQKIQVLAIDTGQYPYVSFSKLYINGTLDEAAVITKLPFETPSGDSYSFSLSGTYPTKPTSLLLTFTADGSCFNLAAPYSGIMMISDVQWNKITSRLSFLTYIPSASYLEKEQSVTFDGIYINGTRDESATIARVYSETYEVVLSGTYTTCPSEVTLKAVTSFGAFAEEYYTYSGNGWWPTFPPNGTNEAVS